MRVIGITGGVGAGKSAVLAYIGIDIAPSIDNTGNILVRIFNIESISPNF